jgi:ABC-type sugar transport system substrate-binding protein
MTRSSDERPAAGSPTRRAFLTRSAVVGGAALTSASLLGACSKADSVTQAEQIEKAGSSGAGGAGVLSQGYSVYDDAIRKQVAGRTLQLGFTPPILSEFFNQMEHAAFWRMNDLEKRFGVHWKWERASPTGNFNAVEQQVSIVQNWAARKFDAILVCTGANFATMQNVYRQATARGAKLFQFNQPVELYPPDQIQTVSNIGYDNRWQSGYLAGTYIAKKLGGSGKILQIWGPAGSDWSTARQIGLNQALKENPGLKVVGKGDGGYVRDQGFNVTQDLLTKNPDVNAIYGENEDMALGASQAIDSRGLKHWDGKSGILTIGADGLRSGMEAIRNGSLTASVDVGGVDQGLTFVETIFYAVAVGNSVGKILNVPTRVVDKSNVDAWEAYINWALKPPKTY